jgi:hypothetical protein
MSGSRGPRARLDALHRAELLAATGVASLTGGFQSLSLWLIETFPQFGQAG